ncbi:thiol:disulfide interchange protein DsbA/DsbL [Duganella sp. BJB488]|uniref:thiol:disulfide interchange protein DsbA/DsbL n=1 Tax=unclassified Duganella TaxID=2636909 RepID=UPI000E349181|nr:MULTISPECIES: thiol:disulfide interchange protein DsbA/DsbL [unclassified Duganella]NVD73580.1 thiol:disulfide interchange protein DsbA/DsbL [Duganella sp. BJB1802]RFP26018.1 thiol:disulfide interchange protein DsbA/DsbL [Duganella sp. BJB489]RFP28241.1 thiol:disulfide interchange protein DsbA/DsbL [Duganella sp. BJB488]RFP36948.1 thiol:disulfide interchange protein DsbA/DsbL [Duganella sp. BJB480]
MLRLKLVVAATALLAGAAFASPTAPKNGAEYTTLKTPQPVQAEGKKVEVIEFFMYHCPACYALEPAMLAWVKKQGDGIVFRRIHLPLTGENDPEAHMFLTLEALKLEESLHAKLLTTWHVERRRLKSDADNIDWAVKNGVDKDKYVAAYNSFSVIAKLKSAGRVAGTYEVNSTPTLIVNGRYLTNPSMVDASNPGIPRPQLDQATLQVLDALVAMSRK